MSKFGNEKYSLLKTATRRLIDACGGVEAAALISRVGKTSMSDYQNIDKPDCFMPADVAADLERACGQALLTATLVRWNGGYFVKPKAEYGTARDFAARLPEMGKEYGEVMERTAFALSDGKMSSQDRLQLKKEIEESIAAHIAALEELEK